MLNPSSAAFSLPSLFALIGSIAFGFAIILGRGLRGTSDTTLVTWQTLGSLVVGAAMAIADWARPSALDWGAMLLLGVVSCAAHLMITRALKLAPASTLAPLHHSLLLWAAVFGLVFFGDVPSARSDRLLHHRARRPVHISSPEGGGHRAARNRSARRQLTRKSFHKIGKDWCWFFL